MFYFPKEKSPFDYLAFLLCLVKLFIDHILSADSEGGRDSAQNMFVALPAAVAGCFPPLGRFRCGCV